MLLDKMRALTPPGELKQPTSLFWYAFLLRLLPNIHMHCVRFVGMERLANVARPQTLSFGPSQGLLHRQVCSVPREYGEYGEEIVVAVQDTV